jgi:hypothetical protein
MHVYGWMVRSDLWNLARLVLWLVTMPLEYAIQGELAIDKFLIFCERIIIVS